MLHALKKANVMLSVATNAPTKFAQTILSHLNVAELFDVIIGADKVNASKPDPKMLYNILNFYSFDKNRDSAWMVGDNSKDIQSALNAGINSMFATWGFSPHAEYETVIKEPKEVLSIVL
jgi:phosphoglycolate phosphatase